MLCVVDIGNSTIVLAFFDSSDKPMRALRRAGSDPTQHAKRYAKVFEELFASANVSPQKIEKTLISSVVPALTNEVKQAMESLVKTPVIVFNTACYDKLPVKILEISKNEIGTDLLANAVYAFYKYKKACIVVDFGTALTFTVVNGSGTVCGVAIAPGLQTACKALFSNTAQLPTVLLEEPESVLGTTTVTAIQSGIVLGYKGLVCSLIDRIQKELNEKCVCIATGGFSYIFENEKNFFDLIDVRFTTSGLAVILEKFL